MAIDIKSESVTSLTDAAKSLPRRRGGKPTSVATLYRWAQHGLRNVRLETIQVGGTLCTSVEALQRFFDRLSRDQVSDPTSSSRERQGHLDDVDEALTKEGI